jgi:hypothetical protein
MSAQVCGKKYANPPPLHSLSPSLPPPYLELPPHHPSANCLGPIISGLLDHVTSSANGSGAPGAQHKFRTPLPPPSAGKTNSPGYLPVEKRVSLSEGLGKEYKKWRETKVGKTGTRAEGRHVVIRARKS